MDFLKEWLLKDCTECGSENLKWFADVQNTGTCVDGRIRMHETRAIFVLGCESCSETIRIVSGDEIADFLNCVKLGEIVL